MLATPHAAIALEHLGHANRTDFEVEFTKSGESIVSWFSASPRPTDDEILAAVLPALKSRAAAAIKAEASTRILAIAPLWKQNNLSARFAELTAKRIDQYPIPLSQAEQDEYASIKASGQYLLSIRTASNSMEVECAALSTVADVEAYMVGIDADTASAPRTVNWP